MPAAICIKFGKYKEQTQSCKTNAHRHSQVGALVYLFNFSYKSDTGHVTLCRHLTAQNVKVKSYLKTYSKRHGVFFKISS